MKEAYQNVIEFSVADIISTSGSATNSTSEIPGDEYPDSAWFDA